MREVGLCSTWIDIWRILLDEIAISIYAMAVRFQSTIKQQLHELRDLTLFTFYRLCPDFSFDEISSGLLNEDNHIVELKYILLFHTRAAFVDDGN